MFIQQIKSPNFSNRNGYKPIIICLHIAEGNTQSVIQEFLNLKTEKSSHYLIDETGNIIQFVDENLCAWANGIVKNPSADEIRIRSGINPNLFSISIEHSGYAYADIFETQYKATSALIKDICQRWNIPIDREHIIGHREIRKDKNCPGKIDVDRIVKDVLELVKKDELIIENLKTQLSLWQQLVGLLTKLIKLTKLK